MIIEKINYLLFESSAKMIYTIAFLQLLDVIIGVLLAVKNNQVSSAAFINGIFKKVCIWFALILCYIIENYFLPEKILFSLACNYAMIYEILSCFENLKNFGIELPQKIKDIISKVTN